MLIVHITIVAPPKAINSLAFLTVVLMELLRRPGTLLSKRIRHDLVGPALTVLAPPLTTDA